MTEKTICPWCNKLSESKLECDWCDKPIVEYFEYPQFHTTNMLGEKMSSSTFVNNVSSDIVVLEDCIKYSKWAKPSIDILREHMTFDGGHDEGHITRVVRNSLWFGEGGDPDIIIPSAILHDLVNLPKTDIENRRKSSKLSANKAIALLELNAGFKDSDLASKIAHAIEAHSFSANVEPTTLEACAVQDADRVEALGFIGLARLFSVGGSIGRIPFHPTDPIGLTRPIEEYKYTLDHFRTKLITLADTMKTPIGRKLSVQRTQVMLDFIYNLAAEVIGCDYITGVVDKNIRGLDELIDTFRNNGSEVERFIVDDTNQPKLVAND